MSKSADAFRTISEVADWLGVQTHVLRFWESKFTQVKPVKRAGGRRYYRPADMLLLGGIRKLLHDDGLTIKGVQKILREEGMAYVSDMSKPLDEETEAQLDSDLVTHVEEDIPPAPVPSAPPPISREPTEANAAFLSETVLSPTPVEPPDAAAPPPPTMPDVLAEPTPPAEPMQAAEVTPQAQPEPVEPPEDTTPEAAPFEADVAPMPTDPPPSDIAPEAPAAPLDPIPEPIAASAPEPAPETEPEVEPQIATEAPAEPAPAETHTLPSFLTEPLAPAPTSPVARVVDVPDDADPASYEVAPSALTRVGQIDRLSPDQISAIRPLVAQLSALRDQMAGTRTDAP
ncbi:MerR family transcriptional regulator [uncultured Tateyamaria sp.]|uniref:MerR family transcriptional regulator n=1 Tax=uncultured Tateyamaria sp. TaxID=455651 RepID=UPI002618780D|nr:MerR family transcriptional regulator [uncultured Tateyamaria sp.]